MSTSDFLCCFKNSFLNGRIFSHFQVVLHIRLKTEWFYIQSLFVLKHLKLINIALTHIKHFVYSSQTVLHIHITCLEKCTHTSNDNERFIYEHSLKWNSSKYRRHIINVSFTDVQIDDHYYPKNIDKSQCEYNFFDTIYNGV